jgi:hypothetical protein
VAVGLVALVLLLLLASSLPVASAALVGPLEAAICVDESSGGHAQHIDILLEPLSGPVAGVTSPARGLGVPTFVPTVCPHTRGVLRL